MSLLGAFLIFKLVVVIIRAARGWLGRGRVLSSTSDSDYIQGEDLAHTRELLLAYQEKHSDVERIKASAHDQVATLRGRDEAAEVVPKRLSREERKTLYKMSIQLRERYLDLVHLGWYQLVIIFLVGSVLGLFLEEIWMYVTAGLTQSRVGLVWGPFSPLYGFGGVLLTVMAWRLRKHNAPVWAVFLISAIVGGLLEQITGWTMQHYLHAYSWSYLHLPDAISQWVAWRFLFFWGLIGLIWYRYIMPEVVYIIGMSSTYRQVIFVGLLAIYLAFDIFMTVACFYCKAERDAGIPASNSFEVWVDEHFNNEFIEGRFQNLVFGSPE